MTVGELIRELQKHAPNLPVFSDWYENGAGPAEIQTRPSHWEQKYPGTYTGPIVVEEYSLAYPEDHTDLGPCVLVGCL